MTPPGPETLGERLDAWAGAVLAHRGEVARRIALRQRDRRWDPPAQRRLRVEADVPPAWEDEWRFGDPGSPAAPARFPAELRERLRALVGPGLERAELHDGDTDPAADGVARAHGAAAVTVGRQIFLRQGRFRPRSAQGRALLAHEAVHAALAARPDTGWRRATAAGRAREERAARAVATAVLGDGPGGGEHRGGENRSREHGGGEHGGAPVPASGTGPAPGGRGTGPGPDRVVTARRVLVGHHVGLLAPDAPAALPGPAPWPDRSRTDPWRTAGGPPGSPAVPGIGSGGRAGAVHVGAAGPGTGGATAAASTPMAAPAAGTLDPPPAPPVAAPDTGPTRESVLRELMRQVRTDRERGA